jgi:hypothetical protein
MIEKKFNMFSTKEWIQFLQYKLTPEREKEIMSHADSDPFLKEALDVIGIQENRPIAFQSLSYLISVIEENTGVSESKIAKGETGRSSSSSSSDSAMGMKIALGLGGLIVLGLIGFGIYYLVSQQNQSTEADQTVSTVDTLSTLPVSNIDSSLQPFQVIPNASPTIDTVSRSTSISSPTSSASKPASSVAKKPTTTNPNTGSIASPNPTSDKERVLFNQAQEAYKQGNREEAKKILKSISSYDNPMKNNAEAILKSIGN